MSSRERSKIPELGLQIGCWRRFKGLSQGEMEARAGLGHNALSRIENGQVSPRLATIEKIAAALELGIEELQFRSPPAATDAYPPFQVERLIERIGGLDQVKQDRVLDAFHILLDQMCDR